MSSDLEGLGFGGPTMGQQPGSWNQQPMAALASPLPGNMSAPMFGGQGMSPLNMSHDIENNNNMMASSMGNNMGMGIIMQNTRNCNVFFKNVKHKWTNDFLVD